MHHHETYPAGYRGARFFKCDLQMQTPADHLHWEDSPMGVSAAEVRVAAEAFVRRCYEEGLEVVAITDHNFASMAFIGDLKSAIEKLSAEFGQTIVLLPGFEIEADVGKGVHLLAVFEPGADLNEIDHLLTRCGVDLPRFKDGKAKSSTLRLPEILSVVQAKQGGLIRGLVILPHSQSNAGIFDRDQIADWLQQTEYTNPDLYCLEVPKPPTDMSANWQKLLRSGEDCEQAWRRARPIATIMSSDCKALRAESGASNYIGRRFSWIKMSVPSIEALRQAFLDHGSRIRLGASAPQFAYPWIQAVRVQGASFLSDIDVVFSPSLNALIGGGGSGKSTIIEYLRVVLHQIDSIRGTDAKHNFDRIAETLQPATVVEVDLHRDGESWTLRSVGGGPGQVVSGVAIPNLSKFFPVRFVSQREIYAIADDRSARMALLDNLIQEQLAQLQRQEQDIVGELQVLDHTVLERPSLRKRLDDLMTERLDYETRRESLKQLEAPLREWRNLLAEETTMSRIREVGTRLAQEIREFLSGDPFAAQDSTTPLEDNLYERARAALDAMKKAMEQDVLTFEKTLASVLTDQEQASWNTRYANARAAYDALRAKLSGDDSEPDPERYLQLDREISARDSEIAAVEALISEAEQAAVRRSATLDKLHVIWNKETGLRTAKATRLQESVPKTSTGIPFVEVSVTQYGDDRALRELLAPYRLDGRRISEEEWDELITALVRSSANDSPLKLLRSWVGALRANVQPSGFPWDLTERRTTVLLEWFDETRLSQTDLVRVPDRVAVRLNRNDGSAAGELEQGLSVGQKCTAILALLLAEDDAPAVIDQPEDDIDNEFTYGQLVPLLRGIKERRQLIIATKDPNIPVNGDAELICALEARAGRGQLKLIDGDIALGALDRGAVRHAVEEIMEGSEEAFRRRSEMYGF